MIELEGELLNSVSYATYYCRLPLFTTFKIFNRSEENAQDISVHITGGELILPTDIDLSEIPHESSMEISVENVLNPKYLADLERAMTLSVR